MFEVDLRSGELRRGGVDVRIQVQPFRILGLLLERAGEIVTREEMRERLWPTEFVDFDHSLNTAVRKLREALGDSAENPRFVETLARRGYRFIAPVSWESDEVATPKKPRLLIPIGIAVLLLAAVGAYFVWRRAPAPIATATPIDAVAVLPFTNDDAQSQYLSDGTTEILIDALSRVPDLRVMARTTVFDYKGKKIEPQAAGRALNVSGVVVGNVRRHGDQYEFHVELIDVKDGTQLWGHRFDATTATMSSVQAHMSDVLATQLRQGVTRESRIASRQPTIDPQAYDAYLWGLYEWNRRDKEHLQAAMRYFNQAIERDPKFAAPYAGLANTYGVMVGYGVIPATEGSQKVLATAGKALELDPNNAEALIAIATTKYRNLWDFAGADADYKRALALNPNYATGHQWYGDYLRSMGRWPEARLHSDVAYRLDPRSFAITANRCYALYYERRFHEAVEFGRSSEIPVPSCVTHSLIALGEIEQALPLLTKAYVPDADAKQLADAFHRGGPRAFFRKSAELIASHQSEHLQRPVDVASYYAQAGDKDQAFAWLEKAYQQRTSSITSIGVEPKFDSIRSDPRFEDLLRRIGLPKVSS